MESPQCGKTAGVARSVDAEIALEIALPSTASGMPTVWGSRGGFSLGRAVGARDHDPVECSGRVSARMELAGNGAPVRLELEERGHDGETRRGLRPAEPEASAGPCDWNRRGELAEGPSVRAAYAKLVREHAPNAQILFDQFHIVQPLNEAVEAVRRDLWRQLTAQERTAFQ